MAKRDNHVAWRRGWVPPEGTVPLVHDAWLPEQADLQWTDSDVVTLEEIRDVPCLVLLGEPGSGKSYALEDECELTAEWGASDDERLLIDLGLTQDARDLRESVFEHPVTLRWRDGAGSLHLFLDALDEAKLQIWRVVSLLEQGLMELDFGRLRLRIACRTAERPLELEAWLAREFGDEHCRTLELAPLRVSETKEAARRAGVDADAFVADALVAGLAPLAARPLTLNMLLRVFQDEQRFPDALANLYHQAMLLMAGEPDPERGELSRLSATASLAVAARVAAATVLCGRDTIADDGRGAVGLEAMVGGVERDRLVAVPDDVPVDQAALQEVLGSALFSARSGGLGWAHRSLGEYLAAYWLSDERLSDRQVASLLMVDDGAARRVAPALRNVVGWLLTLRPAFQGRLDPADAVVLVYGDPSAVAPQIRRRLVPAVLGAIGDQEIERFGVRSLWRRLAYEGIGEDIRPVLLDPARPDQARQAAADAVAELELTGLVPALVDLALDPAESVPLRTSALYALRPFGLEVPLKRLLPLATDRQPGDVDDEIKGAALRLCWPHAMSAEELFNALTPEKNEALLGTYAVFLRSHCLPDLRGAEDLLPGVRWALTVPRDRHSTRDVTILADRVVARAWPLAASEPEIVEALADLVSLSAERHMPVLASASSLRKEDAPDSALHDGAANTTILQALVARAAAGQLELEVLSRAALRPLSWGVDVERLAQRWEEARDEDEREAWRMTIFALAHGPNADALFDLRDRFPELYAHVAPRYEAVALDSPAAEAMREAWRAEPETPGPSPEPEVDVEVFDARVVFELEAFRSGDTDGFWRLHRWLMVDHDGMIRDEQLRPDLTATEGWRRATADVRDGIVAAAAPYLSRADSEPDRWLGVDKIYWPAWAGYRALRLLWQEDPGTFDALGGDVWRRWAPIVVVWPGPHGDGEDDDFQRIAMERVRKHAPEQARRAVIASWRSRLTAGELATGRARLGDLWDASVEETLLAQLERTDLAVYQTVAVVGSLLEHDPERVLGFTRKRVSAEAVLDPERREAALGIASTLARQAPIAGWELLKTVVAESDEAGRAIIAELADEAGRGWGGLIRPEELGRLFRLLERLFPPAPESPETRAGTVTLAMRVSMWRGQILEALALAGTTEAVAVVRRLEQEYDELGWIKRFRHRAEEQLRRMSWQPPEPADVVRLRADPSARYVPNAVVLGALVLEALESIAEDMYGAFPLAPALWNTAPHRLPKGENEISNELARWLREHIGGRRAIVNREVQVNAVGSSGDRTDLLVQAVSPQIEPLTVVVEVKGAWNPDLMTAMDDQLTAKYLKPDLTDQGVYLVFWFAAESWEDFGSMNERRRRARATRSGAAELQALLQRRAAELSRLRGVELRAVVIDGSLAA